MPRRAITLTLATIQTVALLSGTAFALAHEPAGRPTVAQRVIATPPAPVAHPAPVKRVVRRTVKKAAPKPVHHASPRPKPSPSPSPSPRRVVRVVHRTTSLTPQQRLNAALAKLPGYHTGEMAWVLTTAYGHWGTALMGGHVAYVSPEVPADRMYDVVAHEYSHILSAAPYDYDAHAAMDAMNRYCGGSGLDGAEKAADCMARILGATWTHYTSCSSSRWRSGARLLLAGKPLP